MKLLYLSSTSFSDCDVNLVNTLVKKHQVTYGVFITNTNSNYSQNELKLLLKNQVVFNPIITDFRRRDPRNITTFYKLILLIKKEKFDLIYMNDYEDIYFMLLFSLIINRNKIIFGLHDVVSHSGWKSGGLLKTTKSWFLSKFKYFLTFSAEQSSVLKKRFPKTNVFNIPLTLKDFGDKNHPNPSNRIISFLFFGNIESYKGLDILLLAVKQLSEKYDNFRLVVAGRCADWDIIYKPLIDNNEKIIALIRFIKNDEIPLIFSEAHYLILPYKDVTQSGPLMIAYNYAVPVIASNLDGFKEFVKEGESGFLFESNNINALEQVLEHAILRDEVEYKSLQKKLLLYTQQNFSVETIALQYNNMFETVQQG
ncbi:MAG: glycosyltransferase family 4 protein [Janthinobacterium lividum]